MDGLGVPFNGTVLKERSRGSTDGLRLKNFFCLNFDVDQVPNAMSEAFAAGLELSTGALAQGVCHDRGKALAVEIFQKRFGLQNFKHLLGIVFPVGCAMQIASWCDARGKHADEVGSDESPFVVASLSPGVGEVDVNA